uniref:Uncharacterized protein n=1 Tax=Steinernema glaseri TaxID=37863 RepID=A0A1I7YT70_9BILA
MIHSSLKQGDLLGVFYTVSSCAKGELVRRAVEKSYQKGHFFRLENPNMGKNVCWAFFDVLEYSSGNKSGTATTSHMYHKTRRLVRRQISYHQRQKRSLLLRSQHFSRIFNFLPNQFSLCTGTNSIKDAEEIPSADPQQAPTMFSIFSLNLYNLDGDSNTQGRILGEASIGSILRGRE